MLAASIPFPCCSTLRFNVAMTCAGLSDLKRNCLRQSIRACLGRCINRGWAQASIDLNILCWKCLPQSFHFSHHTIHKFLSSKTGLNSHDEQNVRSAPISTRASIGVPGFTATPTHVCSTYLLDQLGLARSFKMKRETIGPSILRLYPKIRIANHQVDVKEGICALSQTLDDGRTPREVRDKVPVHDINM